MKEFVTVVVMLAVYICIDLIGEKVKGGTFGRATKWIVILCVGILVFALFGR